MTKPAASGIPWRIVHSESSNGWGGQEHRVLAELQGFKARGCPTWLVAPSASQVAIRATQVGMPVVPLRNERRHYPIEVARLARWFRRERIQIVNTHSSRDGWIVGMAARLARVPLLIRSRHIDVDYPNPRLSSYAFTKLADHVLTTSDKITATLQNVLGVRADRISTIPTGIELERFTPTGAEAELSLPQEKQTLPLAGMVSVLRSWKGHSTFLEAVRRLNESGYGIHGVIVGGGAPMEAMEAVVRNHGATPYITLAGHREDVPDVLRALDVLAIPSTRHEGVPQIGLQGLACETPIVASKVGGIPEIIRDGETGRLFEANDSAALAARLKEVTEQPAETRRMAVNGSAFVRAEYSLERMLDKLETIYRRYLPNS